MKIAVMGAGALGGYFGGRLAQAGHEVWLIARGSHLEAIRRDGLRIRSPKGDAHLTDIHATGSPADVGRADVILFMVKNRDVEGAAEAIRPMIGDETMVVTCQNGITAWERLGGIVGARHVVPGVARTPGEIVEPGVIRHTAELDMLIFGEPDGGSSDRCERLRAALEEAGTTPVIADNIMHELWSKFCGQTALASLTTPTGWAGSSCQTCPTRSCRTTGISSCACRPRCTPRCSTTCAGASRWSTNISAATWSGWALPMMSRRRSTASSTRR